MWTICFALPNLTLKEAVGNDHISIAPQNDPRIIEITSHSKIAEDFVQNFENQFRKKVTPSFLIINSNTPRDDYGIVCYRNALAVSTVIKGHEHGFSHPHRAFPLFSDPFDFYPITVSKDYGYLISYTADEVGFNIGHIDFRGQRSPGISKAGEPYSISDPLFNLLQKVWEWWFIENRGNEDWPTTTLFRSLEMAYRATAMPMANNQTISDIGTSASLWVSAFESLAHPGNEQLGPGPVLNLIGNYPWANNEMSAQTYEVGTSTGNLAQKLYFDLYQRRNDFIHGNPVKEESLFPFGDTKVPYFIRFAPLIFKIALYVHLEKHREKWNLSIWPTQFPTDQESKWNHDRKLSEALRQSEGV